MDLDLDLTFHIGASNAFVLDRSKSKGGKGARGALDIRWNNRLYAYT
jgi:hypothetical protein